MVVNRMLKLGVVVMLLAAATVVAQQNGTQGSSSGQTATQNQAGAKAAGGQDLTIEQLYLSQDVELQILRSQALATDRASKELALQTIRSGVQDGTLTADNPGVLVVLQSLASEGVTQQVRAGQQVTNDFPDIRREAVNILGQMGGEKAKSVLLDVLGTDNEPMVLSEAVYALGRIGLNDSNDVTNHIVWVLNRENAKAAPDNNLAFACCLAVEKLAARGANMNDPEIVNSLLGIASGKYIRDVRLKAIDVIYKLRNKS